MASSSVLPAVHQLLEHVSQLLQRSSQAEAETTSVTLLCLELKAQIEQAKASVVEERMKQLVCREEIARLKEIATPRRSGSKGHIRNSVHSSLGLNLSDRIQHDCNSRYPRAPTSLETRQYYPVLGQGVVSDQKRVGVQHDDDWRRSGGPPFLGFFARQEERNVF